MKKIRSHIGNKFVVLLGLLYSTGVVAQHDVFGSYFNSGFNSLGVTHYYKDFTYIDSTYIGSGLDTFSTVSIIKGTFSIKQEQHGTIIECHPQKIGRYRYVASQDPSQSAGLGVGPVKNLVKHRCLFGKIAGNDALIQLDTIYSYKKINLFLAAANYFNQNNEHVHGWYIKGKTVDSLNAELKAQPRKIKPQFSSPLDHYFLDMPIDAQITDIFPDQKESGMTQNYVINKGSDHGVYEGMEFLAPSGHVVLTVEVCNPGSAVLNGEISDKFRKGARVSTKGSSAP